MVSQSVNWVLKSAGEAKSRPGMNEVSKNPLRRSTIPLDSGSCGLSRMQPWWPACPVNAADPVGVPLAAADAGLVVPDQPPRDPAELLEQLPHPQQQVLRCAGSGSSARA